MNTTQWLVMLTVAMATIILLQAHKEHTIKNTKLLEIKSPLLTQKKSEEKKVSHKTITLRNSITEDMITKKHWSGSHIPSFKFALVENSATKTSKEMSLH